MRVARVVAAIFVAAGCVHAAAGEPQSSDIVTMPAWAERGPAAKDFMQLYPEKARSNGIEDVVYLSCLVLPDRTFDCTVASATLGGYGFEEAALLLSKQYVIRPDVAGAEPGKQIRLPIRFQLVD